MTVSDTVAVVLSIVEPMSAIIVVAFGISIVVRIAELIVVSIARQGGDPVDDADDLRD